MNGPTSAMLLIIAMTATHIGVQIIRISMCSNQHQFNLYIRWDILNI